MASTARSPTACWNRARRWSSGAGSRPSARPGRWAPPGRWGRGARTPGRGARAAELAGVPEVLEVTISRDHVRSLVQAVIASGEAPPDEMPDFDDPDLIFGMPDDVITTTIDVTPGLDP